MTAKGALERFGPAAATRFRQTITLAWIALAMELVVPLLPLYGPYDASGHFRSKIFAHVRQCSTNAAHILHCTNVPLGYERYLLTVGPWVALIGIALVLLHLRKGRDIRFAGYMLVAVAVGAFVRAVRIFDTANRPGSIHTAAGVALTIAMGLVELAAGALVLRPAAAASSPGKDAAQTGRGQR